MPSDFANMETEYLLDRLHDKDVAIEDLIMINKALKRELLDVHAWIAEYVSEEKNKMFAMGKLQARILGAVAHVPTLNVS